MKDGARIGSPAATAYTGIRCGRKHASLSPVTRATTIPVGTLHSIFEQAGWGKP